MTQYDKDNLAFLMTASTEVLADWYSKVSSDDTVYASELLKQAYAEWDAGPAVDDADIDCSMALALLAKYRL